MCYDVAMPKKPVEFTKTISIKLTPEMYRLISIMRQVYGNDADVVRAGIMALWREFDALPRAEAPPSSAEESGDTAEGGEC